MADAGEPSEDNHVLPQGNQVSPQDKDLFIPSPMTDGEIMSAFINLAQVMTTLAQAVANQTQAMISQEKLEVGPHVQKNASTTTSRLRDFTRMNPPVFFGLKVNEISKT